MNRANNSHEKESNEMWWKMLIVGQVSSIEERNEIRFVAEMFLLGERIRYLARQNDKNKKENKK